ncbi:TPA: hypothetical protein ACP37T_003601 [Pseudomonas aeruginosa]
MNELLKTFGLHDEAALAIAAVPYPASGVAGWINGAEPARDGGPGAR